ncbi:MAG: hypothetical protein WDZ73_01650 [Candidatus Paceibacterota bacterium]
MKQKLIDSRNQLVENIKNVFQDKYDFGFLTGSLSGNSPDFLSDVDIWLVANEEAISDLIEKRLEDYKEVGEIAHICEPPHHSPIGGLASTVIYKNGEALTEVDYYLCSDKTAKFINNAKLLFGELSIPVGFPENIKERRPIPDTYRLDFFLMLLFIAVKKTYRNDKKYLDMFFDQYQKLKTDYGYSNLPEIENNYGFETLENYTKAVEKEATNKQREFINEIRNFINLVN